jgi:hypothetical protein
VIELPHSSRNVDYVVLAQIIADSYVIFAILFVP